MRKRNLLAAAALAVVAFLVVPASSTESVAFPASNVDSADHKSHMAYPVGNAYPASHPMVVPKVRQVMRYPVNGNPDGLRLASGAGFTMHRGRTALS
jgi:hypothetical protein